MKTQQDCLNVQPVHIKLVQYNSTKVYVPLSGGVKGRRLKVAYLHAETGDFMHRAGLLLIKPDEKVHLFRSKFDYWYHAVQFLPLHGRFVCVCGKYCRHAASMNGGMVA